MSDACLYLLPGLMCDRHVFEQQLASLPAHIEIRVADFRGFDSLSDMAESVLAAAPKHFALLGHSMGGRVALQMARLAPERIERLALLDTGAAPAAAGEADQRQQLVNLAYREGMTALAARWLPPMVHPRRLTDEGLMRPLTAMVERMTPDLFERQVRALLNRPDARSVLPGIRCPTMFGVGRQDGWSPLSQHQDMALAVQGATLEVFEDCGHMSTVESPTVVTAAMIRWLERSA